VSRYAALLALSTMFLFLAHQGPHSPAADDKPAPVSIRKGEGQLDVLIDGKPFFSYQYDTQKPELRRPVIHPLHAPDGAVITQLGEVPGKRTAHYWHTGLWVAHQNFTQGNNWQMDADPEAKPRKYSGLLHRGFDQITNGETGRFVERLEWDDVKGDTILLEETRTVSVPHRPAERRVIDLELVLKARAKPVTLQATPYQILALRPVNAMVPAFSKDAAITNSEGQKNPKDGEPAKWIDVTGPLDGKTVGVSLFNHPDNLRHPTPCLNFSNQTIGLAPTHKQAHTLQPNESLRLRFRVLVHAGTPTEAKVAGEYEAYCKGNQ
jgi:hypothetical protein